MVEILGKNIRRDVISEEISSWTGEKTAYFTPEVIDAIKALTEELAIPCISVENGRLYSRRSYLSNVGEGRERHNEIVSGFNRQEKNVIDGVGHAIAVHLVKRTLKGEFDNE